MEVIEKTNCPNCGAPITTEICPYCNTATGIKKLLKPIWNIQ